WVIRTVRAPMRAAAAAASQPAWPPPITATSNRIFIDTSEGAVVAETVGGVKKHRFSKVFHVKHLENPGGPGIGSLANKENSKEHVQAEFPIDPAGEATQGLGGDSQFLRKQVFAIWIAAQRTAQRGHHVLQGASMTIAGHQCGLRSNQIGLGMLRQLLEQSVKA